MYPILAQESSELSGSGTLFIALFVIGFYFAVGVAIVVYRRRQKRWALWSGLSAVVPIASIVVPVMALRQGRAEPVTITEPCPGCSGHEGWAEHGRFDRESEKRVPSRIVAVVSGVLGVAIALGAVLLAISIWRGGNSSCSGGVCIEWENGALLAGVGFLALGLWIASLAGHWALEFAGAEPVEGTSYRCAGCDHRWVRLATATPVPAI